MDLVPMCALWRPRALVQCRAMHVISKYILKPAHTSGHNRSMEAGHPDAVGAEQEGLRGWFARDGARGHTLGSAETRALPGGIRRGLWCCWAPIAWTGATGMPQRNQVTPGALHLVPPCAPTVTTSTHPVSTTPYCHSPTQVGRGKEGRPGEGRRGCHGCPTLHLTVFQVSPQCGHG